MLPFHNDTVHKPLRICNSCELSGVECETQVHGAFPVPPTPVPMPEQDGPENAITDHHSALGTGVPTAVRASTASSMVERLKLGAFIVVVV